MFKNKKEQEPKKNKELKKIDAEDLSLEELNNKIQKREQSLENYSNKPEASLENMSVNNMGMDTKSDSYSDFKVRSNSNKRREHLSAKEDQLLRKREEAKAKANRKLVNGSISLLLICAFAGGIYTAFPEQVTEYGNIAKDKVLVVWGGVFNKDIKGKISNDIKTNLGMSASKSVSENLSSSKLKELAGMSIDFVSNIPDEITKENASSFKNNIKEGNYLVGRDIPSGMYYGDDTIITVYDSASDLKNNKNGKSKHLEKDFYQIHDGQFLSIQKLGTFIPNKQREENIIDYAKLKENTNYEVGKDVKEGVVEIIPKGSKAEITITSSYGIVDAQTIMGTKKIELKKGSFINFNNVESIKSAD